jgi:hypothetical protein
MTIYLIKYTNNDTNETFNLAFSNLTDARKELNKLIKYAVVTIYNDEQQGPIRVFKPKNQADVINLINSL